MLKIEEERSESEKMREDRDLRMAFNLASSVIEYLRGILRFDEVDTIDLYIGTKVTWNVESKENVLTLILEGRILRFEVYGRNTLVGLSPENLEAKEMRVAEDSIPLTEYDFFYKDQVIFAIRSDLPYTEGLEGLFFSGPFLGTIYVDWIYYPLRTRYYPEITIGVYKVNIESYLRFLLGILKVTS